MSRQDCICNRNIKIIATYLNSKLGNYGPLFNGLTYPAVRYASADEFFLNEDEWTTLQNFHTIFRRAKALVGEPYFYFNCGASTANLRSWGRLDYFVRVFASSSDGFKRLPFFNKNLNDTKTIEIIIPPKYDRTFGKLRTVLKVQYNPDVDVHRDYMTDPYRRGIISAIPTIWGLLPATVKQPLNPYDPEILFNQEPEFASLGLDVKMEDGFLTMKIPLDGERRIVGREVLLEPERINGHDIFLGKYGDPFSADGLNAQDKREAILITETVEMQNRIIVKAGEIFRAPYFILDVTYDQVSLMDRLRQTFKIRRKPEESGKRMVETINRLRETMAEKNRAYYELEKINAELTEAKNRVDHYARNLKQMVEERTAELTIAKEELLTFNRGLKAKVDEQFQELKRYSELRRYLSPKLTEQILSRGDRLGAEPQRKMMTVLFSDIRNFSALTENLEPEEIFELMDRYISEMTTLIHQYEGTLNKIIGDGLLVFFGDPIPMEDHVWRAVTMAVEMQKMVARLKDEWLQYGHELNIGIGINTGYMTVGNIGSDAHRDYTVIGHQVNVAARLESLAKPGQILVSQRTYSRVKDLVDAEKIGEIRVKGVHDPVLIYNVIAFPS